MPQKKSNFSNKIKTKKEHIHKKDLVEGSNK